MKLSRAVVCALGSLSLAACDIPTDTPTLNQRWIIPAKSTTIDVGQMLPGGVTLAGGGSAFLVNVPQVSVSKSLVQACPACAVFNGLTAPVPAFRDSLVTRSSLPVASATLSGGTVQINVQNNFGFDPTANGGSATVTITDGTGGRQLGSVQIGGAAGGSLPTGQTTTRTLPLLAGAVRDTIVATTVIDNKGGQVTTVNTSNQIVVTAIPSNIQVSQARVGVGGKSISFTNQTLDVDISDDLVDHVQSGSIILTITNPFGVAMTATLTITVPQTSEQQGRVLNRSVSIGPGSAAQTVTLTYSGDELRSFLGKEQVRLSGTGSVAGSAGQITVTPTQKVGLDTKLDLTILVG